jgi:hypothetical protein
MSSGGGILQINRRRKTLCGGFEYFLHPRERFGHGNGDYALPHRYQLPTCTPSIRECEPRQRGGSHSKQGCSTDARSMGGGYARMLIFQICTRVPYRKRPGKWLGKRFRAAAGALAFFVW